MVAVLQTFPMHFLDKKLVVQVSNSVAPVEVDIVAGCLLSNSLRILEVSMLCPITGWNLGKVSNVAFLPVNISNGDGSVDEIGVVRYCRRPKFHGFSLFQRFVHQLLGDAHQSFSESIALWVVGAAGDMVRLIEIQEVVKFP